MTCAICGTETNNHDKWRHRFEEKLAKLQMRMAAHESLVAKVGPLASGKLASAGDEISAESKVDELTVGRCCRRRCRCRTRIDSDVRCEACAEAGCFTRQGDMCNVPAEQPSRQETGGGEGKCCGCGYDGEDETECTKRDDGQHCVHWYDGPAKDEPSGNPGEGETMSECAKCRKLRPCDSRGGMWALCEECWCDGDRAKAGEAIDWSRFVPTQVIPEDQGVVHGTLQPGDVFAAWADSGRDCGSVRRFVSPYAGKCLAGGVFYWHHRRVRLIRHADGRWADGYHGPSVDAAGAATEFEAGPCRPDCGSSDGCKSKPCFFVHCGATTHHFCTPFCRARFDADRAKAKAAEQAQRETWASVEKNAAEVRTWPEWKQRAAKAALEPSGNPGELPPRRCECEHPAILGDTTAGTCVRCDGAVESPAPVAGTLSDNVLLINRVAALEAKLAQAERERDERKRKATAVPMRELPSDIP